MPTKMVLRGLRVSRMVNGKPVTIAPKIGELFEFTTEEYQHLKKDHPNHIRDPRNENPDFVAAQKTGPTENIDPELRKIAPITVSDSRTPATLVERARQAEALAAQKSGVDDL